MSKNVEITTNTDELIKQFSKFNMKEMKKANRSALAAGARKLAAVTKRNLRLALPKSTINISKKYTDTLIKGVRYKVDKKTEFAKIHIMGRRGKGTGTGTWRLRFFEKGTKTRINKKSGKSYGSIKAYNFFSSARNSTSSQMRQIMLKKLIQTIEKINELK